MDLIHIGFPSLNSRKVEVVCFHSISHSLNPPYQLNFRTYEIPSDPENSSWFLFPYKKPGSQDIIRIQTSNTRTGAIELQVFSGLRKFKERVVNTATLFGVDDEGTYDDGGYTLLRLLGLVLSSLLLVVVVVAVVAVVVVVVVVMCLLLNIFRY